jgi:hypothetical protein
VEFSTRHLERARAMPVLVPVLGLVADQDVVRTDLYATAARRAAIQLLGYDQRQDYRIAVMVKSAQALTSGDQHCPFEIQPPIEWLELERRSS